ncbi:membrane assembly protein AsmA [Novimethylophilus kurashikiensis]|uniref:Membrane assembly protein AsmA n=1 Tax=Novimethylophilus kurashikiensis TaxID=1825523 RepID=A0A2R5F8X4_9PROT|nr:hypothetical protein [Novimethylophilus kurashikiensis]GBG14485.1 membrane assembly protein AsmA [Novimethylophilus kurashikiensis]
MSVLKGEMLQFGFECPHIGAPVMLVAEETAGVRAMVYRYGTKRVALIADGPNNKGVSVTNGFSAYANKLCELMAPHPNSFADVTWYELDSMGRFDEVSFKTGVAGFGPLTEASHAPSSKEAFLARMWRTVPTSMPFWHKALMSLGLKLMVARQPL